jgi:hypothetical protein
MSFDDQLRQPHLNCHSEGIVMSVWTPAHDENVAQASCLHERRLQARCLRYIFVVIFLSAGVAAQN